MMGRLGLCESQTIPSRTSLYTIKVFGVVALLNNNFGTNQILINQHRQSPSYIQHLWPKVALNLNCYVAQVCLWLTGTPLGNQVKSCWLPDGIPVNRSLSPFLCSLET